MCYPGTSILKNRLDLRDEAQLDAFQALITAQRGEEPLPRGRFLEYVFSPLVEVAA